MEASLSPGYFRIRGSILNSALGEGRWRSPCLGCFISGKKPWDPLYSRWGRHMRQSGRMWRKCLITPGFEPWNVQAVASRYDDYANPVYEFSLALGKSNTSFSTRESPSSSNLIAGTCASSRLSSVFEPPRQWITSRHPLEVNAEAAALQRHSFFSWL